ncbi:hypothetical protein [Bacillus sp. CHD6a]|uniref:hypothetical protein n=1 Tax=Bacillus sp. CHD6a TaxID=1643452 RepID=UPI0006CCDC1E|nr:hypothetical protein [Bacillus sp. CHD6a]KPB05739.1 hypothetical protein AAV98_05505 [Bacillus sp. CHD6a]
MKKILIITDLYYPKASANGVIVRQVALALKKNGYEVHIVSYKNINELSMETIDDIRIFRTQPRLFFMLRQFGEENIDRKIGRLAYKFGMFLNKLKRTIYYPRFPLSSISFIYRYFRLIEKLHREHKYSLVISIFHPFESFVAGAMLKKKIPDLKFILYAFDSLSNVQGTKFVSTKTRDKKGWFWERKLYKYPDKIYNMKSHTNHYNQERYDIFRNKMEFLDIPLFQKTYQVKQKDVFDKSNINWVYAGSFDYEKRNPVYLIKLFLDVNEDKNSRMHFYSRGNCEEYIIKHSKLSNNQIVRHGFVNEDTFYDVIYNADVLVNIGVKSDAISGKIFQYISTGRKIIHIYESEDEPCLEYLKNYPYALLINTNDDYQSNINKTREFINKTVKPLNLNKIAEMFNTNTPEYAAEVFDKFINKDLEV